MGDDEQRSREHVAKTEARALGYALIVDEAPNMPAESAYMVFAAPVIVGQTSLGRFLLYAPTRADAAEAGADIVRAVVERGEPWPEAT